MRTFNVSLLVALLAAPVGAGVVSAPLRVSLVDASGDPYSDIEVSLVGLDTGRAIDVRSDQSGTLQTTLVRGDYVIDLTRSGLAIDRGPRVIHVEPGQWSFAVLRLKPNSDAGANFQASTGDFGPDDSADWWGHRPRKCKRKHHSFPCPVSPSY